MADDNMIFVDGFFSYDIPDNAPAFVLGKSAVKVERMIEFLQANKQYAVNGFLYFQTLRSKKGDRYTKLDLYQFEKAKTAPDAQNAPTGREYAKQVANGLPSAKSATEDPLPVIQLNEDIAPDIQEAANEMAGEVNVEDIPF